jgi:hypothetical protein
MKAGDIIEHNGRVVVVHCQCDTGMVRFEAEESGRKAHFINYSKNDYCKKCHMCFWYDADEAMSAEAMDPNLGKWFRRVGEIPCCFTIGSKYKAISRAFHKSFYFFVDENGNDLPTAGDLNLFEPCDPPEQPRQLDTVKIAPIPDITRHYQSEFPQCAPEATILGPIIPNRLTLEMRRLHALAAAKMLELESKPPRWLILPDSLCSILCPKADVIPSITNNSMTELKRLGWINPYAQEDPKIAIERIEAHARMIRNKQIGGPLGRVLRGMCGPKRSDGPVKEEK